MKIIVGLGNPGKEYENTRHNAGFMALDYLAGHPALAPSEERLEFSLDKRLKSRVAYTIHHGEKVILTKPDTFMNASGTAVSLVMQYYKTKVNELIVIADDIDIPLGEARIRLEGGSAGQKGLQDIIDTLGTQQFIRIRIGINENLLKDNEQNVESSRIDTADYVLQRFSERGMPVLNKVIEESCDFLVSCIGSKDPIQAKSIKISR